MEGETGAASVACCWPERSRASSAVCGALMEPIYSRADASSLCGSFRSGFFSQGLDNFGDTIYNHKACKSETLLLQAKPCGRGGMADALDLGSSANRRGSSSLFARTICGSSSVVECHLAKVDVASPNLVYRSTVAPWPSGKAKLCKSFILQFDSGWRLQIRTQTIVWVFSYEE